MYGYVYRYTVYEYKYSRQTGISTLIHCVDVRHKSTYMDMYVCVCAGIFRCEVHAIFGGICMCVGLWVCICRSSCMGKENLFVHACTGICACPCPCECIAWRLNDLVTTYYRAYTSACTWANPY